MRVKILTEIFFSAKEERSTRGHEIKLAKKQCRLDIRTCYKILKSTYISEGRDTRSWVGWTLDKTKSFLVHLPSRIDCLGGNLVKPVLFSPGQCYDCVNLF